MKAQKLYDLREKTGFCSGQDLHGFFLGELGDPSPSGYAEIDEISAIRFVKKCHNEMHVNSPNAAAEIAAVVDAFVTGKNAQKEIEMDNMLTANQKERLYDVLGMATRDGAKKGILARFKYMLGYIRGKLGIKIYQASDCDHVCGIADGAGLRLGEYFYKKHLHNSG